MRCSHCLQTWYQQMISGNNRGVFSYSRVLRVGHHFRHGPDLHTGIYRSMISEWRQQLKIANLWQHQAFRHGPLSLYIYWTASCVLCMRNTFLCTTVFLVGPHAMCPFGTADWLNWLWAFIIYTMFLIKKKKCKKSLVASAVSSVALHGLPEADHCSLNTEPGIAKLVALFHHLHQIVDSSWQFSPDISPKDCFKYGKFWGVDNF